MVTSLFLTSTKGVCPVRAIRSIYRLHLVIETCIKAICDDSMVHSDVLQLRGFRLFCIILIQTISAYDCTTVSTKIQAKNVTILVFLFMMSAKEPDESPKAKRAWDNGKSAPDYLNNGRTI